MKKSIRKARRKSISKARRKSTRKAKRKYKKGGAAAAEVSWKKVLMRIIMNSDIKTMESLHHEGNGAQKPVCTINQSLEIYNAWQTLTKVDKNKIQAVLNKKYNLTFYPESWHSDINAIICYNKTYFPLLEQAYNEITQSNTNLLDIISNIHSPNTFEYDIIQIAFGEVFKHPPQDLKTEEGEKILEKYKELANLD